MDKFVFFELNNWMPVDDYPPVNPYRDWMENVERGYTELNDNNWVKENELRVVISAVDMSINFCITAKLEWVEKNCPSLLTKYTDFLRYPEEDEDNVYGRFGCKFITDDDYGIYDAFDEEDYYGCDYYRIEKRED